jgi:predicted nucleic acid-binding protein
VTFVLDASLTLAWLLDDANAASSLYAASVLKRITVGGSQIVVPAIWGLEIANVLARSERKAVISEAQTEEFKELLSALPIGVDAATSERALNETLQLSRRYGLSSYNAAYLELAMRTGSALATLDNDLREAAVKAGVKLLKVS